MSKPRFTEGPWRVEWGTGPDSEPYFDILKSDGDADDDGRMIDASYSIVEAAFPVIDMEVAKANANLIAAAPDLYDALMKLRDSVKACCADRAALRCADLALAYARGEHGGYGEDDR